MHSAVPDRASGLPHCCRRYSPPQSCSLKSRLPDLKRPRQRLKRIGPFLMIFFFSFSALLLCSLLASFRSPLSKYQLLMCNHVSQRRPGPQTFSRFPHLPFLLKSWASAYKSIRRLFGGTPTGRLSVFFPVGFFFSPLFFFPFFELTFPV